jgi:chorismate mutase
LIIEQLVLKSSSAGSQVFLDQLEELRAQIDKIDEDILQAISSRLELTKEIGSYKKDNNVTVFQLERWNEILQTRGLTGDRLHLRKEFIHRLYETIHSESIRIQTEVIENDLAS